MSDDAASSEPEIAREQARQLAEHHYYAALDLVLEGHHEQAVEEYQKAVAADPKFTDALHGLSRALQDLSRFDWPTPVSPSSIRKKEWFPKLKLKETRLACWGGSSNSRRGAGEWNTGRTIRIVKNEA